MNTRFATKRGWVVGIGLTIGFLGYFGFYQLDQKSSPPSTVTAVAAPAQNASDLPPADAVENPGPPEPVTTASPMPLPPISDALAQVLDMSDAGVDETVLLAFIRNSKENFEVGPDQIIFLRDLGIGNSVISAMIRQDAHRKAVWQAITPEKNPIEEVHAAIRRALATPVDAPATTASPQPQPIATAAVFAPETPPPDTENVVEGPPSVEEAEMSIPEQEESLYPVRAPYPVKLTDTILVFRAQPRTPNLVVIRMLP